jgi:hypothetical protein
MLFLSKPLSAAQLLRYHERHTFGTAATDWATVQRVFRRAWTIPAVRLAWDALLDEYGER